MTGRTIVISFPVPKFAGVIFIQYAGNVLKVTTLSWPLDLASEDTDTEHHSSKILSKKTMQGQWETRKFPKATLIIVDSY